ncbi:hypothetical protein [Bradyrhizobium sp. WSM3983]|uniref:hypothetical protein n=1 Tax=Bradyrhizobium sp. WSM3983 TaxID=1038867 RepID=UPI0012EBFBD2|nr:hypothetical protein [Bradyrhizobium sp. WSM3983]
MKYTGSVAFVRARQNYTKLPSFTEVMTSTSLKPKGSENTTTSSISVSSIRSLVTGGRRMPIRYAAQCLKSADAGVSAAISQSISVLADE